MAFRPLTLDSPYGREFTRFLDRGARVVAYDDDNDETCGSATTKSASTGCDGRLQVQMRNRDEEALTFTRLFDGDPAYRKYVFLNANPC